MTILLAVLLVLALIGTASSTVFLAMALVAAVRHHFGWPTFAHSRQLRGTHAGGAPSCLPLAKGGVVADSSALSPLPPVTILKPLHGAEPRLEENLESFFLQDYPSFEILFGCRNAHDPALDVVERLRARYPRVPVRIVLSGEPTWPNAKVWSLDKMIAASIRQYLVLSDSDMLVRPDFLRAVVTPLLDPQTGLVTCMYRGIPDSGLWSQLEALGMSVEFPSGVLIADMLEGMRFALGAAIAVRRDVLDNIGGISTTRDYYSDDFLLGNLVHRAGYRVLLSQHRVAHVLCTGVPSKPKVDLLGWTQSFTQTFATQVRWMQSTRYSRPLGHLGTGLTFAVPFGLLGLAAASALGHLGLGFALLAASLLNRMVQSIAIGYGVIRDRRALTRCWLYPLRDLMGFFVWLASYWGGSTFRWRGELYRFTPGGRIESVSRRANDTHSATAR